MVSSAILGGTMTLETAPCSFSLNNVSAVVLLVEGLNDRRVTRTKQGAGAGSLRHAVQQTRLCRGRTVLVESLHPAQRAYSSGPRRLVQSGPRASRHTALRQSRDPGRRCVRHRAWA